MDNRVNKINKNTHPREKAGWFSILTFGYTLDIFKKSWRKEIKEEDLYRVYKKFNSKSCGDYFERQWNFEKMRESKPSVIYLLWRTHRLRYCICILMHLIWKTTRSFVEPTAMMNLIVYFKEDQTQFQTSDALYYAFLILLIYLMDFVISHNVYLFLREIGVQIRNSLSSFIYRKTLKLRSDVLDSQNIGNIVTLITKDVNFIELPLSHIHELFTGFIQIFIICFMIYNKLGVNSVFGLFVFLFTICIEFLVGLFIAKLRLKVDVMSSVRLQRTKEAFSDIKIIKMNTWENYFNDRISEARRKEVNILFKETFLKLFASVLGTLASPLSIYVLIMTHVWFGRPITAEIFFFILSCFRQIKILLSRHLPKGIGYAGEIYGAMIRITKFLHELDLQNKQEIFSDKSIIFMKNVYLKINNLQVLNNVSLNISSGLTCITGPMGSGKSVLLKTILNDFPAYTGNIYIAGQVSYVSQEPWIFPSTIKQNILFGNPYNKFLYEEVLRVCALDYDLNLMETGDKTMVLEKGGNLSKGQQIRINLARALYRESDIYLLDDCFSSLDVEVGEQVFYNAVQCFLKNKVCVYVTQNLQHLNSSNVIIEIRDGTIMNITNSDKAKLINNDHNNTEVINRDKIFNTNIFEINEENISETSKIMEKPSTQGVYFEKINTNNIPLRTYWDYLKFGRGVTVFSIIILVFILAQASLNFNDKLLSNWVDLEQKLILLKNNTTTEEYTNALKSKNFYLILYSTCTAISVSLLLIRILSFFDFTRVVSLKLSEITTKNLLHAKISFFDSRSLANILNRFSLDFHNIDEILPNSANECFLTVISVFGAIVLIIVVNWLLIIPILMISLICYFINIIGFPSGRKYIRLEASTKCSVVGHLNATLEDLVTVRSYRNQDILIKEFDSYLDKFTSAHHTAFLLIRSIGFFIDVLILLLIFCIIAFFLLYREGVTAGNVGLAITQIFMLSGQVQWGLRTWIVIKLYMTSTERILEYTNVEQERTDENIQVKMPVVLDAIKFINVNLLYPNKLNYALKNVTFEIKPREKVGIVGRTGSGKSSLISVLFKLYDVKGKVLISNTDIKTIPLEILRQNIAIVPQNPVLFSGSVKNNIDPLNEYNDETIWSVLEKFKVKHLIEDLHTPLVGNGKNLTIGQKQLICLARAAMRQSKILVIDEVTANMDEKTEKELVNAINNHFADKTVISIAHRLNTILHCEKIIVLDKGEVVEVGAPSQLIQNIDGYFYKLVKKMSL
ncbi:unnamed protein product [Brassicogethes aeneus]|uniref:Multidrug resistance-associated protein lethal(2)03659 n=1 Tax=Brassicogethes aeneus TaxID=1431903 RepID=A0A9P0APN2_BRAAE|nr:unnamed protein product [Brassicogethes aeneus]